MSKNLRSSDFFFFHGLPGQEDLTPPGQHLETFSVPDQSTMLGEVDRISTNDVECPYSYVIN